MISTIPIPSLRGEWPRILPSLVACECSGTVRDAFAARGHDAISCDLKPAETGGPHYCGSVVELIDEEWDLVVAHPPCTYLSNMSSMRLRENPDRMRHVIEAAQFFALMAKFRSPRLCIENPIQIRVAQEAHGLGRPTQWIEPYEFGHPFTKTTGLWLRGLPPLVPTEDARLEMLAKPAAARSWVSVCKSATDRSRTFPGIAAAMADQWG